MKKYEYKSLDAVFTATMSPENKKLIYYTRNGKRFLRQYKRVLKVPHAFSLVDMMIENITSSRNVMLNHIKEKAFK